SGYGYLNHIEGLHDADLFSEPDNRNETTAHFTFFATATLLLRTVLDEGGVLVHALDSSGPGSFYLRKTPGASFDDPSSFAQGKVIATFTVGYQSVVNAFIPAQGAGTSAQGTGTIFGSFSQLAAPTFGFKGKKRRLGVPGMEGRLSASGFSTRTDSTPTATFTLAGNVPDT